MKLGNEYEDPEVQAEVDRFRRITDAADEARGLHEIVPSEHGRRRAELERERREIIDDAKALAKVYAFVLAHWVRILAGVVIVAVIGGWIFQTQRTTVVSAPTAERIEVEAITSNRDATYEEIGPWETSVVQDGREVPAEEAGLAWLHNNGTIESSIDVFPAQDIAWQQTSVAPIDAISIEGDFTTFDAGGVTYTVYNEQPFILNNFSESVFFIESATRSVFRADTATVIQVLDN